ncbi:MAG: tRNA pseudouridine(38-40) synthase TruA [Fimbriimonadaceae bacterium]
MSTNRIKLVVAYDGTDFCGWAANPGTRTVQGTLTDVIRELDPSVEEVVGASRTDSGTHARGQVCHFDTFNPMPATKWAEVLNRQLPLDLKVSRSTAVTKRFHSRFCADSREYRYRIRTGPPNPFEDRYAFQTPQPLRVSRMEIAAKNLVGKHDFRAFTEELDESVENTVRTLHSVEVRFSGSTVSIKVIGTAFLRGMMRRISGALFQIGRGNRDMDYIKRLLDESTRDGETWPVVLPARGLTLVRVRYANPLVDVREKTVFP